MTRKRKRFLSEMLAMAAVAAVAGGFVLGCADNGIGGAFGEIKAAKGGGGGSGGGNGGAVAPTRDSTKTIYDYRGDKKEYSAVKIGNQWWMAENLNYDTANGTGSWCYGNSQDSCTKYGRLYNWNTAMAGASSSTANPSGVQGVCPSGWHLPSRAVGA
jgi:hypothetical protein